MQRTTRFLGALAVLCGISGPASAGYWEVVYDLTGSTVQTIVTLASSTDVDTMTGSMTIQYPMTNQNDPVTSGRLTAGTTLLSMNQTNAGLFLLTGTTNTVLKPGTNGTNGTIVGQTLTLSAVADSDVTGFIHCTTLGANCSAANPNFAHTFNTPQTPVGSGPFPVDLGKFAFIGGVGTSDFTSTGVTVTQPGPPVVTLISTYVGKESTRTFHYTAVPAMSDAGRYGLGLLLLLGGASTLGIRKSRKNRQAAA